MRYVGIYWSLFAPMIKKSIRTRFDTALAERSIREGKKEYKRLLSRADELGPGNPMAMNAYFAYVFAAAWLGSGRTITPEEMALVMTDVLESKLLRTVFGMTDLNRQPKKWYRDSFRRIPAQRWELLLLYALPDLRILPAGGDRGAHARPLLHG